MEGLIQLIAENWSVVSANWKLFAFFGILCCGVAFAVLTYIYDKILYKDLPEKTELYNQVEHLSERYQELKAKYDKLEEDHRKLCEDSIFLNGAVAPSEKSIGEVICEALKK
ncbi:MAG: hypothetical protein IJB09_07930 [Oscillospiraceae bacterium]|nr:hypothetical protein [Oscillospiraceae bacterium]